MSPGMSLRGSSLRGDGVTVPSGAIQAEIFPGALRVFCAAPLAAARTAVSPPERAA